MFDVERGWNEAMKHWGIYIEPAAQCGSDNMFCQMFAGVGLFSVVVFDCFQLDMHSAEFVGSIKFFTSRYFSNVRNFFFNERHILLKSNRSNLLLLANCVVISGNCVSLEWCKIAHILVEFEKCWKANVYAQKSAPIQLENEPSKCWQICQALSNVVKRWSRGPDASHLLTSQRCLGVESRRVCVALSAQPVASIRLN